MIYLGCAGWSIPKAHADRFPGSGTHLERYAGQLPAAEINSSFYHPHLPATYARWAASVPEAFRFAVKVPREITHFRRLVGSMEVLEPFLRECAYLGQKLGPLLVQLPPSLAFDLQTAEAFFGGVRERFTGSVVCEPRHESWFSPDGNNLLAGYQIARAAADPAVIPDAAGSGGWQHLIYYRLHGFPRMYYSAYSEEFLVSLRDKLMGAAADAEVWCIFDNTALGAATANALALVSEIAAQQSESRPAPAKQAPKEYGK